MNDRRRTKVVIIISNIDKAVGFEWIVKSIDKTRFELSFILLNSTPSHLHRFLKEETIPSFELCYRTKLDLPFLLLKVSKILRRIKPDVVHTHLFEANVVGQTAAWILRIPKRIYTRHSSNENRRYHGKQRWDHYTNRLCTDILAISENVRNVLIQEEGVPPGKITLIHHGFDLDRFANEKKEDVLKLATKYNPEKRRPVVGVISRYSHWKGIQFIIPAFERLLEEYPAALLILANAGRADYSDKIEQMLSGLPKENFCEIVFEPDIFSLYRLFDVYVHVPIDPELEAFGQTYVEALAAEVPSVFTLSGVALEFVENRRNALVVDYQNSEQIYFAVSALLRDSELRTKLTANGRADVRNLFTLESMITRLQRLYSRQ
jgi:glycosyltransferase involved in cell wall biosynthesis